MGQPPLCPAVPTPQAEPLEGMVPNSAGGHAFPVDDMTRLHRFLILGSEGGSYYADERKLTLDNVKAVKRCITASEESGINAVTEIARISKSRRAAKPGPALFALAMAASYGSDKVRKTAFDFLNDVALTGSHLQMFIDYIGPMRGWGRGLRKAVGNWYTQRPLKDAVYQTVKYRQRYNWTHRDLLRKSHPMGDGPWTDLFAWITHGTMPSEDDDNLSLIHAYEEAKVAPATRLSAMIRRYRLSWEMVPSEMLDKPEVWRALAQDMPMTALLRNLATLTRVGVIAPMESAEVCETLKKIGTMHKIHPIAVLTALLVYKAGKGVRGKNDWIPVPQVVDALDAAFGRSFSQAPQTNKRLYLGIDVSGSMTGGEVAGVPGLSPRMAAAAMAMAIARREPNYYMAGFAASPVEDPILNYVNRQIPVMSPLNITASDSISDAMQKARDLPFGRTDCALPMLHAMEMKMNVDCFIILTDSETWTGNIHPVEALRQYRHKSGIPAKLVVVGMVSNEFTIADPDDAGMMDVVGFDSAVPELITDFAMSGGAVTALPWGEVEKTLPMVHSDSVEPEDVPAENVGYTDDC